mmetsp:Transcript_1409/g.2479  ORF Transcript_1409/g.2479 Transcript_1409/m.2479 type:complete len:89 (+) Transcript_1409:604-870(+)
MGESTTTGSKPYNRKKAKRDSKNPKAHLLEQDPQQYKIVEPKRGALETFMHHSKKALKKTIVFVVFLAVLMIISFFVSEYELSKANQE